MLLRCRIPLLTYDLDIDVSFKARITAFFGPSGSGKTTLLDAIAGLRPILAGEIEIDGETVFSSEKGIHQPPQKRGVGYVPQEGALFPHLSVEKNILFGAKRTPQARESETVELDHVLEVLAIRDLLNRPVTRLSGGEAQRVALARAILSRPRLLLLDEPLAALDLGLKEKILPYLGRVRDEFHIPMIYVTHNLAEVLTLADWVLMIQQGKLIAQGIPQRALRSVSAVSQLPDEQFENVLTATFIAADAIGGSTRVRLASGQELFVPYSTRPADEQCRVGVNADDVLVATQWPAGISASNVLPGTIRSIERIGGEALLTVHAGEEFLVRITSSAVARLGLRESLAVFLIIKTRSFRWL